MLGALIRPAAISSAGAALPSFAPLPGWSVAFRSQRGSLGPQDPHLAYPPLFNTSPGITALIWFRRT